MESSPKPAVGGPWRQQQGEGEGGGGGGYNGGSSRHVRQGRQQPQCRQCQAQYHLLQWQRRVPNFGGAGGAQEQPTAVRSQRTNWKNGHPCSSSSFIDMNRRHVLGLTFVMVQHVLTFLSDWAMYFLAINLLLSIYYSSDLLHLLHHWFEWPPFGERGSLERDVWISSN